MKTYDVSLKRTEHGHILVEADSIDEALSKIADGEVDFDDVTFDWGYNDENWTHDEEWGAEVVKESD